MQTMNLKQLRSANDAGGIDEVILKASGGAFHLQIATRSGVKALLSKARSDEPRRFANPTVALNVLHGVGITAGRFDASEWRPDEKDQSEHHKGRARAMREAHRAAAYNRWLAAETQKAIEDPRPNLSHKEVMAQLDSDLGLLETEQEGTERSRTNN